MCAFRLISTNKMPLEVYVKKLRSTGTRRGGTPSDKETIQYSAVKLVI